jgi:hypothetical protein
MFRLLFFSFLFFLGYQLIKLIAFILRVKRKLSTSAAPQQREPQQTQQPFSSGEIRDAKFEDIS